MSQPGSRGVGCGGRREVGGSGLGEEWEEGRRGVESTSRSVFSSRARSTQQHARRQNQAAGAAPVKWAAAENASCPSSHGAGGCPGRETPPARDSRAGTMEPLGGLRQLQLPAPATRRERREPVADRGAVLWGHWVKDEGATERCTRPGDVGERPSVGKKSKDAGPRDAWKLAS